MSASTCGYLPQVGKDEVFEGDWMVVSEANPATGGVMPCHWTLRIGLNSAIGPPSSASADNASPYQALRRELSMMPGACRHRADMHLKALVLPV